MADEAPIVVEVEFKGATEAARGAQSVGAAVSDMGTKQAAAAAKATQLGRAQQQAASSAHQLALEQTAAATKAIQFGQRIAGVANAVQALIGQLGGESRTAGLIGATITASAQFAQLGAALGPQGAIVGGIVGAVIPALQSMMSETDRATEASARLRQELADQAAGLTTLTERISEQNRAREEMNRLVSGGFRDRGEAQGAITSAEQAARDLPQQIAAIEEQIRIMSGVAGNESRIRAARRRISTLRAQELRGQITAGAAETFVSGDKQREAERAAARESMSDRQRAGAEEQASRASAVDSLAGQLNEVQVPTVSESTSPAARAAIEQIQRLREVAEAAFRSINEHSADFDEQLRTAATAIAEVEIASQSLARTEADMARQREEDHVRRLEQMELEKTKARERDEEERQRVIDRMRQTEEYEDALMEANRRLEDAYRAQAESYKETTGVIVGGLTDALAQVIAGQKSAEEAFKGLLAAFLKFISEQAILKAASEYAFAIADFASQNYGSGALHLAAGVAFTAVAVAAGAGSAALSAPSGSAGGPEEGRSSRDNEGGGGGTVVINYNSPVIALSDRAQMGRELRGLMTDADSRFGA